MIYHVSIDDVENGDLEFALAESAGVWSRQVGTRVVQMHVGDVPPAELARRIRNAFSEKSVIEATEMLDHPNEAFRICAQEFFAERQQFVGRWCGDINCLRLLPPPAGTRGRKRQHCNKNCAENARQRRSRDRKDPGRNERLKNFEQPRYVFRGFTGIRVNRRKRAHIFGFQSIATPEFQARRHASAVAGRPSADTELLAELVDGEWLRRRPRPWTKRELLEHQRAEATEALEGEQI